MTTKTKLYICFENKGEVPINAFKLLGASSKRDDSSKIGYFGTGLKYAIAVMLRQGIEFRVFSGEKEVKIGTRKTKFLDSTVDVMTVNNEKTSITLDAGVDWEPWFAIREIYSNTIDENGTMNLNTPIESRAGHTRIFIDSESEQLKEVFNNWNSYFSQNRDPVFRNAKGSLLPKLPTVPVVPANFAGHYDITESTVVLPDKLLGKLKSRFGEAINIVGDNKDKFVVLDGVDKRPLQKLLDVFTVGGFDWKLEDIDIVRFEDNDILGMAHDGRVLLSTNLFTPTQKHRVAATLIEEIAHAKTGYSDGTRQMQDYLFNTITNLAKELSEVKHE